jgi:hypothetical protein
VATDTGWLARQLCTELGIETAYLALSEMRKDFATWVAEAEFTVSDFVVGVALDMFVVSILAPAGVLGKSGTRAMATAGAASGLFAGARRTLAALPPSCFAAAPSGLKCVPSLPPPSENGAVERRCRRPCS